MKTVDKAVQEYYSSHSLDDIKVHSILKKGKQRYRMRKFSQIAAIFLFFIVAIFSVSLYQTEEVFSSTVAEIRRNHLKGKAPKIESGEYGEVSQHLSKLAFAVTESKELEQYALVGGLYCSVQGNKAAQLKLITPQNDTATLFVTEWEGSLKKLKKSSRSGNGVTVSVWKENDLFYGLAVNSK